MTTKNMRLRLTLGLAALGFIPAIANAQVTVTSVRVTVSGATLTGGTLTAVYCDTSFGASCGAPGTGGTTVWDLGGGVNVGVGQTLILTQTALISGVGGNFDTSDRVKSNTGGYLGPYAAGCFPVDPCTVTIEINGDVVYTSAAGDAINAFNNDNEVNEASPWALAVTKPNYTLQLAYADNEHSSGAGFPTPWQGAVTYFKGAGLPNMGACSTNCYDAGALLITGVQALTGCTLTQGGYTNHFNSKVLNLPAPNIQLGNRSYTNSEINDILQNTAVKGNGLISLANQLITAKLNIRYGASAPAEVLAAIVAADALIANLVVPPVGSGYLSPSITSNLTTILDNFNNGVTGPGHCG